MVTLNVEEGLVLYYRNGNIVEIEKDCSSKIDLREISGAQNQDFNLVFTNREDAFVEECKKSENWLQALYCIFNFEVGIWVEVQEFNALEFLDAMYYNTEQNNDK